jgi:cell division protein FtsL
MSETRRKKRINQRNREGYKPIDISKKDKMIWICIVVIIVLLIGFVLFLNFLHYFSSI